MRKIDKYISKEKMCNLVANRAEKLFELSSEESNYLRNRLKKYDKMELQHLYHNFTSFGVREGSLLKSNAMIPDTIGTAMEVPLFFT